MSTTGPRRFATLAIALVVTALGADVAQAGQILTAKSLACGGSGPQSGTISTSERGGALTIRVQASGLVPGQAAICGYTCGMVFTTSTEASCGTVAANGRFSGKVEVPIRTCFGFIPFFNTPSTGKCVPSVIL